VNHPKELAGIFIEGVIRTKKQTIKRGVVVLAQWIREGYSILLYVYCIFSVYKSIRYQSYLYTNGLIDESDSF
jgi:hypothetical protein